VSRDYSSGQFVGIDLHRRRSVICRMSAEGEVLESVRIENDRAALLREVAKAGAGAPVAIEATYGWYWAVDALQEHGFDVHLAHPKGLASFQGRRVKTDWADAKELVDLLRLGRFPEAYIAPVELRELRELVRLRHKLVQLRTAVNESLHAVLGKCGQIPALGDLFGPGGTKLLNSLRLPEPYASRVASQRRLLLMLDNEVDLVAHTIHHRLEDDPAYQALLKLKGIGPTFAAVFIAEIGDVTRFGSPHQLACWAGLTPRLYSSDTKARQGHISKQGSRLLRWAAIEACQRSCEPYVANHKQRIRDRRGKTATQISKVAAARKLLHVVYYVLRDGHARCLQTAPAG
jgi:transposase